MKLTRIEYLLFVIVLSILLNIYCLIRLSERKSCSHGLYKETEKPLGGTEIDTDRAKELVANYEKKHPAPEIRGFMLSRKAFDEILDDKINSIVFYLIGDKPEEIRIVARGVNSENTGITTDYGNNIFVCQSLCPTDCFDW